MRFSSLLHQKLTHILSLFVPFIILLTFSGCAKPAGESGTSLPGGVAESPAGMTVEELLKMPKIDSHAHVGNLEEGEEARFIAALEKLNMCWLDICTVGTEWEILKKLTRKISTKQ